MRRPNGPLRLLVLLITFLGFILRATKLEAQSYWIDEAWTLFYAHQSPEELLASLRTIRAAPPLYHLLTLYWVQLAGDGEFALRYLSLSFSLLAIPLTYRLGQTIGSRRIGLVAALLLAVAPYQIWHAQDARNYALLTAAATASMWSFFWLWRPTRRQGGWWLIYLLSTEIALFTHYHGLVIIGVQGLYFLLTWRQNWRHYLPWGAALLICLTPLALWLSYGSTLWQSEHWLPLAGLGESYLRNALAFSVGELAPQPLALYLTLVFGLFYALGLWTATGLVQRDWAIGPRPQLFVFLAVFTLAPNLPVWLYSLFRTPIFLERYLIPIQVGYLLTVAVGLVACGDILLSRRNKQLATLRSFGFAQDSPSNPPTLQPSSHKQLALNKKQPPTLRLRSGQVLQASILPPSHSAILPFCHPSILPIFLLLAISTWVLYQHYTNPAYAKPDWRGLIHFIETYSLSGDAILLTGDGGEKLFDYYYRGDLPVYHDFNTPVPPAEAAEQRLTEIAAQHRRLWYTPYGVEIDGLLESWLARHAYPAWQSWLGRKRLALYGLDSGSAPEAGTLSTQMATPFDGKLSLEHISRPETAIAAGDLLSLALTWRAPAAPASDYQLSLRLINRHGDVFAQSDWPPLAAGRAASTWPANRPLTDRRSLWLPFDTPPGKYLLQLIVYDPASGAALGRPAVVEGLRVAPPPVTLPPAALSIPNPKARPLGELTLVGHAAPETLQPGQELWLWLYWQAQTPPNPETTLRLTLTGSDGQALMSDMPLLETPANFAGWQPGQVRRAVYHLPTSPVLAGRQAQLTLALLDPAAQGLAGELTLPPVKLDTRARTFDLPPIPHRLDAVFGDPAQLTLLGYETELEINNQQKKITGDALPMMTPLPSGSAPQLLLSLYWQPQAEIEIDYTVFVQLLGPAGQVVAQVDLPPLAGQAPTRTWLPGEILTDPYRLLLPVDLPPGVYRLITGLYEPATGRRLPVAGGGDAVELQELTIP